MSVKEIILRPIAPKIANELVKKLHYSGKVVNNSTFHIGVYYQGKLEGAMQFGHCLDKRKIQGLVSDTGWNEFIELNRVTTLTANRSTDLAGASNLAIRVSCFTG